MDKIVASLEDYDSILDCPRPNCSSPTWYLEEKKVFEIPHVLGGWNILDYETGKLFKNNGLPTHNTHFIQSYIDYKDKNNIDGKHIYIINIHSPNFFQLSKDIGFDVIDKSYIQDVKDNKAAIILMHLYEGFTGSNNNDDLNIIDSWIIKHGLPKNNIHFFSGNLNIQNVYSGNMMNVYPVSNFETWAFEFGIKFTNIVDYDCKKLFLSYNRQPRLHRLYFASELLNNDLLNVGVISLSKPNSNKLYDEDNKDSFEALLEKLPLKVKNLSLDSNHCKNISLEDYTETFVSIVTETIVNQETIFITEKTWKPIMVGHPFMVIGNQYTLSYLKRLGYKTFDKWWDESYDKVADWKTRIKIVVNNLLSLKKLSSDELIQMRDEMKSILKYNQSLFYDLHEKNFNNHIENNFIRKKLFEIYNKLDD
jgi:hypothetical protein